VLSWITRSSYSGWIGSEILFVHSHRGGREVWYRLGSSLVLFRLMVPPLQSEVVGPYSVWSTWFPSRLPLEEVGSYPKFLVIPGGPGYKTGPQFLSRGMRVNIHAPWVVSHLLFAYDCFLFTQASNRGAQRLADILHA
jgi:hypothetical protein